MTEAVDLSIIVCTYNGAARLPDTLTHLLSMNDSGHSWEIVLIDNASKDDTARVAGEFAARSPVPFRVLHEPRPGKVNALRHGLSAARGRIFTIVDDDNHLAPDWVGHAINFMDTHPSAGVIGGRILPRFEAGAAIPADFETRYKGLLAIRDYGPDNRPGELPIGAGMTGRTRLMVDVYETIGSFLSDRVGDGLGCSEDLEKSIIIRHLGWETWYVSALRMHHYIPPQRLTERYIDRLWTEAGCASCWLDILQRLGPDDPDAINALADNARKALARERRLCFLPPVIPRLRRARFWRDYYTARVTATEAIARRHVEVRQLLQAVRSAPRFLRPSCNAASPVEVPSA